MQFFDMSAKNVLEKLYETPRANIGFLGTRKSGPWGNKKCG
jgi:hypothetical protein